MGTCKTPAALIVSKECPSEVLAFPMVPKATSFPLMEKSRNSCRSGFSLYSLEAKARPSRRGICPAVQEMSDAEFFISESTFQLPSSFRSEEHTSELQSRENL